MSMPKQLMGNSICNEGPMNQPSLFDVLNTFSLKLMSVTSIPPLTPKWTPCARAVSVMADRSTTKVNNFFIIVFNICEVAKIQKKSEWSLFFHIFYELQSFLGALTAHGNTSRTTATAALRCRRLRTLHAARLHLGRLGRFGPHEEARLVVGLEDILGERHIGDVQPIMSVVVDLIIHRPWSMIITKELKTYG